MGLGNSIKVTKRVLIVLLVFALLIVIGYIVWRNLQEEPTNSRSENETLAGVAVEDSVCGASKLKSVEKLSDVLNPSDGASQFSDLSSIKDEVLSAEAGDLDKDPLCQYVLTYIYVDMSDSIRAAESLTKYENYNTEEVEEYVLTYPYLVDVEQLRVGIDFLEQQRKDIEQQTYYGEGYEQQ